MTKIHYSRVIFTLVIAVLMYQSAHIIYGIWDESQVIISTNEVHLGESAKLNIKKQINQHTILVPKDSFMSNYHQDEIVITYKVTFNKLGNLKISIDPSSIIIGDGDHNYNDLIGISINDSIEFNALNEMNETTIAFNEPESLEALYFVDVQIKVYIKAPINHSDMDSIHETIKNQTISFEITFEAINKN